MVVDTAKVDIPRFGSETFEPRKPNLHDQVILDAREAWMVFLLHQESHILARQVSAFMADVRDQDLGPGAGPGRNMNVDRYYPLLSDPGVAEDAEVEDLTMEELLQGHVQNVDPFFGGVASGTR